MVQTESLSRKQRIERAIEHAIERRWDLAAEENRALLDEHPDDVETANRLGKALTELGDPDAAAEAYRRALAIDAMNVIARKNLARLEQVRQRPRPKQPKKRPTRRSKRREAADLRAHALIEEPGTSAEFPLLHPSAQALKRLAPGDTATLEPTDQGVEVRSATGVTLGGIEPRAGLRLKRMIEGGNEYAVVIRHVDGGEATVYVRETHTDPSLVGQASFIAPPAPKRRKTPRAYTKPSIVQHDLEAPEPDEDEQEKQDEQDGPRPRRLSARATRAGEMEERGFTEAAPDEDGPDADGLEDDED